MTALLTPDTDSADEPARRATTADPAMSPEAAAPVGPERPSGPRRTPTVTAVLVVRNGSTWLPATLDGLAAQTRPPERLVVVDLASSDDSMSLIRGHERLAAAVPRRAEHSLGTVTDPATAVHQLAAATTSADDDGHDEWWWLLHDDTAPEPTALAELVAAVRRSPSVGIAGPKVLDWHAPRHLLEIGHLVTRTGRPIASPTPGEPDQGQFDTRGDVLAVGLPGMLVRRALFERIGGFGSGLGVAADTLDLGWRAQLAGERVVVVPAARVREAGAPYAADRTIRPEPRAVRSAARVAARRVALARCSAWLALVLAGWIVLSSLASAVLLMLLKRPAHAAVELGDLRALVHPVSSVRARWRFRGARQVRRADLATLFVGSGEAARHTLDRVAEALTPDRSDSHAAAELGALETGPVAEEAEDLTVLPASLPQRILTNPGVLATLAAGLASVVGFATSLRAGLLDARGAGLGGGELGRVVTDSGGLWHAYRDGWHGAGLGSPGIGEPYLGILAGLTWLAERLPYVAEGRSPAAVVASWLLLAGMPLATAAAYLAGRVITRAGWPRALAALAWGASSVAAAAVSQGRVTVVLAHILLPLVAAGLARSATAAGTFTGAAATALGAGLLGALVPVTLAPALLVAAGLVVLGPGLVRRARGLIVLTVPVAVLGPSVLALADPARLVGAPGTVADPAGALQTSAGWPGQLWSLLLGRPIGTVDSAAALSPWLGAALALPVLAAAVVTLARRAGSRPGAVARVVLVCVALIGLAAAVLAERVQLGAAVAWSGVGLQLYLLGVLALALLGSVGMRAVLSAGRAELRRAAAGVGLGLVALSVLASVTLLARAGLDGRPDTVGLGRHMVAAVALDQARGPEAGRLVVLTPSATGLTYELVGAEPGVFQRGVGELSTASTDPGLVPVVLALASGSGASEAALGPGSGRAGASVGERLADLGIAFVSVQGTEADSSAAQALLRTLDATPGLTRLGSTEGQTLWRVLARTPAAGAADPRTPIPPSRLRLTTAAGEPLAAVPVSGPHGRADTQLPAGPPGRRLVVAESPDWAGHAVVTLDGAVLTPTADAGPPAYQIPAAGGRLQIAVPAEHPRWSSAQLLLLAVVLFLAVPFGNRRSRRVR